MPSIGDQAIKTAADDRLDREQFAADVAQSIRSIDSSQGYVFGLLGPWGSGKTSLGNLIVEKLQQEPAIPVVEFNPWLFAGTESLIDSFFKELSAQLRLKNPARYSNLADQIDRYSQLLTPLTWIPVIGPWAGRIKTLAGVAKSLQSNRKDSVHEQRTKLSNALDGNASPILVLIDDIDRLSRREVQDIFRLVRLTASFPNIIYLLAFDRDRVEAALCEEGMPGRSYLEKIIQTVWDVPVVPHHILLEQLVDALNQSLKDVANFEHFDETRWPDTLAEIISPLIRNMRDAKRYAASIPAAVSALQHQVDLGDILALEALRIFLPDTFAAMARAQMALTSPAPHFGANQENPAFKAQINELLSLNEDKRDVVRAALRRLFPASVRHFENSSYGPEWRRVWLKERRVANADILAHYLARIMPAGLSAFNDAERAVDLVRDPASLREVLASIHR
ncbi:P-loop NTPase fold protein [Dietzia sp. WMMA184]|uniref:KAP family P-loop NTPase fold protein n=1 Tax=Dietzia sp. WMMA184 TaxID=2039808 RepID=UPI000BDF55C4|nr:P-loop NTPase fold protein [Dietzia sp. WMMA184]